MIENIDRANEDILISEITGLDWAADDAIDTGLRPDHFQYPDNRVLFEAVYSQRQKGESVNAVDLLTVMAGRQPAPPTTPFGVPPVVRTVPKVPDVAL